MRCKDSQTNKINMASSKNTQGVEWWRGYHSFLRLEHTCTKKTGLTFKNQYDHQNESCFSVLYIYSKVWMCCSAVCQIWSLYWDVITRTIRDAEPSWSSQFSSAANCESSLKETAFGNDIFTPGDKSIMEHEPSTEWAVPVRCIPS